MEVENKAWKHPLCVQTWALVDGQTYCNCGSRRFSRKPRQQMQNQLNHFLRIKTGLFLKACSAKHVPSLTGEWLSSSRGQKNSMKSTTLDTALHLHVEIQTKAQPWWGLWDETLLSVMMSGNTYFFHFPHFLQRLKSVTTGSGWTKKTNTI